MVISIQFKDKYKVFKGKLYDFKLAKGEEIPKKNSVVRLMDNKAKDYLFYGTRVRVADVKFDVNEDELEEVTYIESSLDD